MKLSIKLKSLLSSKIEETCCSWKRGPFAKKGVFQESNLKYRNFVLQNHPSFYIPPMKVSFISASNLKDILEEKNKIHPAKINMLKLVPKLKIKKLWKLLPVYMKANSGHDCEIWSGRKGTKQAEMSYFHCSPSS